MMNKSTTKKLIGVNVFQRKPRFCRNCNGKSIATYLFGDPSVKGIELIKAGKYVPGGCCIELTEYQRAWCCNECGFVFYKKADYL